MGVGTLTSTMALSTVLATRNDSANLRAQYRWAIDGRQEEHALVTLIVT